MTTTINASTTAGLVQTADTSGSLQLQTANTAALTIDTSQNVGIGTTSPSSYGKLGVIQSAQSTTGIFVNTNASWAADVQTSYSPSGTEVSTINLSARSDGTSWVTSGYGAMLFRTGTANSPVERMRIDSSGNLLINKTALPSGISSATNILYIENATGDGQIILNNTRGSGNQYMEQFWRQGTLVGSIQASTTATTYVTSSDYRLKENIVPMTGALDKVLQLNPVTYTWKADGSDGQGFIAHELQAIVPDCVTGEKDAVDEEGKPIYQGIDTSFLVATLTAAIKELSAKVDAQQQEINALKGAV